MKIIVCENPDEAADRVAREIVDALEAKPDLVLGLATGSTPIGVYRNLISAHQERGVDFTLITTFNLDEYIGLPPEHPQSYRSFMREHLFEGIELPDASVNFPPSGGPGLRGLCDEYEEKIRRVGGIDIQILGIGTNGHIGFNEPTSSLASRTRVVTLTARTLRDNSRFFETGETQPYTASTMGLGTILEAKKILLQAFGRGKAEAVRAIVEGPVSSFWPGSVLQMHRDVTLYLDPDSASRLSMLDYYRRAQENLGELRRKDLL